VLVSKVGAARGKKGEIFAHDEPEQLRSGIEDNLKTLGVETLGVVNLRLMRDAPPNAFFDEQLGAMIAARDDGLIGAVGLSNISPAHLKHALKSVHVACVQNAFHPADRSSQPVLEECTRQSVAFVPFAPLGFGSRSLLNDPILAKISDRLGCTSAQACLAWELAAAPNILLIPGTASAHHLHENLAARHVRLDADAIREISRM
jgi:diketogulonate reductase-like aldo/keto reductase